jgi:hypothetical protein
MELRGQHSRHERWTWILLRCHADLVSSPLVLPVLRHRRVRQAE